MNNQCPFISYEYSGLFFFNQHNFCWCWCWEGLGAGGEGDDRGWDGWMASLTRWTWVWVNSGSWWWTGRPGVLWFMGSQRVRHDWVTELNWLKWFQVWPVETTITAWVSVTYPVSPQVLPCFDEPKFTLSALLVSPNSFNNSYNLILLYFFLFPKPDAKSLLSFALVSMRQRNSGGYFCEQPFSKVNSRVLSHTHTKLIIWK